MWWVEEKVGLGTRIPYSSTSVEQSLLYAFLLPEGVGGGEATAKFSEEAGRHIIGSVPHVLKMLDSGRA